MAKAKPKAAKGGLSELEILGQRVRQARLALGWTQNDLSAKVGFHHPNYVSVIERGKVDLSASKLRALAKVLQLSGDYLLNLSDDPRPHARR